MITKQNLQKNLVFKMAASELKRVQCMSLKLKITSFIVIIGSIKSYK